MAYEYKGEYTDKINEINALLLNGTFSEEHGDYEKFKEYLDLILGIGPFNPKVWNNIWRNEIYSFGTYFRDHKNDPTKFKNILEEKIKKVNQEEAEVLEFIKSEIIVNYKKWSECKEYILELIEKYPHNPEFKNDYGHLLHDAGKDVEAIEQYKTAYKIDPTKTQFLENRFHTEAALIQSLRDNEDYEKAIETIDEILKEGVYRSKIPHFHNGLVGIKNVLNTHLVLNEKIRQTEKGFKVTIEGVQEEERKRLITILGFFAAIIAFILTTVQVSTHHNIKEGLMFVSAIGLVLIIFCLTLSFLFVSSDRKIYAQGRFWAFVITAGLFVLLLIKFI